MKTLITKMLAGLLAISSINMQADNRKDQSTNSVGGTNVSVAQTVGQAACALSNSQSSLCAILGGSVGGVAGLVITIIGILKFVPLDKIGSFFKSLQNLANNASLSPADKALLNTLQEINNNPTYKTADSKTREAIIQKAMDKYNLSKTLIKKNVDVHEDEINNFVKESARNPHVAQRLSDAFTKKELTNNLATIFSNEIRTLNNLSSLKAWSEGSLSRGKLNEAAVDALYVDLPIGEKIYTEKDLLTEMAKNLKFDTAQELKDFIGFAKSRLGYSVEKYNDVVGNYLDKRPEVSMLAQASHMDLTTGRDIVEGPRAATIREVVE